MTQDYFPEEPFGCRDGCGLDAFDPAMRAILNAGREIYGKPIVVNCGCRCKAHNAAVGGSRRSAHLPGPDGLCHAADLEEESDIERAILHKIFYDLGIRRFECSPLHLHVDNASNYLPSPILASVTFKGALPET